MAASSAAERAEGSKAMRRRRGETVLLTFSQQGWGRSAGRHRFIAGGGRLPLAALLCLTPTHTLRRPTSNPTGNLANTLCIVLLLAVQGATDGVTPKQARAR